MATTYTLNYHLGKQEDRSDKFVMKIITDNMDIIDEQLKATDDKATAAAAGLKYKGAVNYYSDLPNDAEIGDAYTVLYAGSSGTVPDGTEYVWGELNGTAQWIDFSKDTYTKAEVNALLAAKQALLNANNKLDPAYINYDSTHRAVSDTEKSTWNDKQNAIDSSHKLSADLVDDTNATNKFATAEELEQIQTNKNNILTVANQSTKYNLSPVASGTASGAGFIIANTAANIPQGDYYFCWTGTADTNGTTINIYQQDDTRIVNQLESNSAGEMIIPVNVPANGAKFNLYTTVANNITNLRIIPKNVYDSGFTAYQPYAMSNAEITAWILSHS